MASSVKLIGLDFGTTTSSAVIASAQLLHNSVTGRREITQVTEVHCSEVVFTPLRGDDLDAAKIEGYLDRWLTAGAVRAKEIFGGGALLTGLTARRSNADVLIRLIRQRLGDALIAVADDPCLESWLSFLGSCSTLSRKHPKIPFLNLDIGGGTTNLALGQDGEVLRTGCLFVGARHVEVVPGSYTIVRLSPYAQALFAHLGIERGPGDRLSAPEVDAVLDFYLNLLEAAVQGRADFFALPITGLHQQVAFHRPPDLGDTAVTLSGGVGELVYASLRGEPWPATTAFGDLGIDLARRLLEVPVWARHFRAWVPDQGGRATVYGLLRHTTQISGSSVFLPRPDVLPLGDLPILGTILPDTSDEQLLEVLGLVQRGARGGCVRLTQTGTRPAAIRNLGQRIARALRTQGFPATLPLVLLVTSNVGKTLGHYVSEWGALPLNLIVIDEIAIRDAQYAQIGRLQDQVIPVSFYGLKDPGALT